MSEEEFVYESHRIESKQQFPVEIRNQKDAGSGVFTWSKSMRPNGYDGVLYAVSLEIDGIPTTCSVYEQGTVGIPSRVMDIVEGFGKHQVNILGYHVKKRKGDDGGE